MRANGRSNSQHFWANKVGVVASVFVAMCKQMQQLPTMLGSGVDRGNDTTHKTLKTMGDHVQGHVYCARARPQHVGRAAQIDPTLSRYVSVITEKKKCWESLAQQFDRFQTLHNNSNLQQHATGCANGRNIQHPTMLHPFAPVFTSPLAKRFFLAFIIRYRKAQRLGEFIGG